MHLGIRADEDCIYGSTRDTDSQTAVVVAGAKVQCKGTGTINVSGNYGSMLTALDGQINGGTDEFRIMALDT